MKSKNISLLKESRKEHGNAVIYVLIALALFGSLMFTLSNTSNQADHASLDEETVIFQASQLSNYAGAAQNVVDQMLMTGSSLASLDFVYPNVASYDIAPHHNKFFHPEGAGFNYMGAQDPPFETCGACPVASGWYISNITNVEWTPSTATDVIITAVGISEEICAEINERITGSTAIIAFDIANPSPEMTFAEDAGGADLTTVECSGCDGMPSLCVSNNAVNRYYYYNIIALR